MEDGFGKECSLFPPIKFRKIWGDTLSQGEKSVGTGVHWTFLDVWVNDLSMSALLSHLAREGGVVFTINPDHVYHLHHSLEFLAAYRDADIITVDSVYLFWALHFLGRPVRHRISGSDFVPAFWRENSTNAAEKVFLLGARPGIAAEAARRANRLVGREIVVGALGPSMKFVNDMGEIDSAIEMINASGATTLFVGLGAPKQEIWISRYRHRMPGVRVFVGVGATLDYEAGAVRRAPPWLRAVHLEWAYRVVTEPRRYFSRYLRNTRFFWWILLERFGLYRSCHEGGNRLK